MLSAQLQGVHRKRLKEPASHQHQILPLRENKKKGGDRTLQDNVFHSSVALQGFLLHGSEMAKLIVALEQIGITPLDALI